MKVGIVGSREFKNYELFSDIMKQYLSDISWVVSGGAPGADSLAEKWAKENKKMLTIYPADWLNLGKRAGYVRNTDIVKNSDMIIAFWDGKSKGTKHTIGLAQKMGKECKIINV
jgi:hypothetical protein